jgi:hypothetical protein
LCFGVADPTRATEIAFPAHVEVTDARNAKALVRCPERALQGD